MKTTPCTTCSRLVRLYVTVSQIWKGISLGEMNNVTTDKRVMAFENDMTYEQRVPVLVSTRGAVFLKAESSTAKLPIKGIVAQSHLCRQDVLFEKGTLAEGKKISLARHETGFRWTSTHAFSCASFKEEWRRFDNIHTENTNTTYMYSYGKKCDNILHLLSVMWK